MTRIKPTRLFHWLLAVAFLAAFGIAQFVPDKNPLFSGVSTRLHTKKRSRLNT
ncbi:MAG: hypothetical protein HY808_10165 [Nitrospirae bacterium]|nr:hypothetical protein [Nitrospirota bacterium]